MCISCFMLFANKFYLLFILDALQTIKMMSDKKQIRAIFIFKFKNGSKQQRRLTKSMHLAQELLMNVQYTGSSRSFAKETRALKMKSIVASHQKLTVIN